MEHMEKLGNLMVISAILGRWQLTWTAATGLFVVDLSSSRIFVRDKAIFAYVYVQIYPATSLVVGVRSGVGRSVRVETTELLEPWRSFLEVRGESCASSSWERRLGGRMMHDAIARQGQRVSWQLQGEFELLIETWSELGFSGACRNHIPYRQIKPDQTLSDIADSFRWFTWALRYPRAKALSFKMLWSLVLWKVLGYAPVCTRLTRWDKAGKVQVIGLIWVTYLPIIHRGSTPKPLKPSPSKLTQCFLVYTYPTVLAFEPLCGVI